MREVREQRMRRLAGCSTVEVPRIILNAARITKLADEREIMRLPTLQPLGLEQLFLSLQLREPFFKLNFDVFDCSGAFILGAHEMLRGKYKNGIRRSKLGA